MAYNPPELVLVGAARNLVLDPLSLEDKLFCLNSSGDDADVGDSYNEESAW